MKWAVSTLRRHTIDHCTVTGRALAAWRTEPLADMGGMNTVSTQKSTQNLTPSVLALARVCPCALYQPV